MRLARGLPAKEGVGECELLFDSGNADKLPSFEKFAAGIEEATLLCVSTLSNVGLEGRGNVCGSGSLVLVNVIVHANSSPAKKEDCEGSTDTWRWEPIPTSRCICYVGMPGDKIRMEYNLADLSLIHI